MHAKRVIFAIYCFLSLGSVWAGVANQRMLEVRQPDGSIVQLKQYGDEWFGWSEDLSTGKVVGKNAESGYFEYLEQYAEGNQYSLVFSGVVVGRASPTQLDQIAPVSSHALSQMWQSARYNNRINPLVYNTQDFWASSSSNTFQPQALSLNVPLLCIQISFTDQLIVSPASAWGIKLFGNQQGQLNHYFNETSYGQYQVRAATETQDSINDGVVRVALPYVHPNPIRGTAKQMKKDALAMANEYVDFSSFDTNGNGYIERAELAILFVVAGQESSYSGESSGVWAQPSQWLEADAPVHDGVKLAVDGYSQYVRIGERHGTHDATMGYIAHELGHAILNLPDLYKNDPSAGIGYFGLMGYGYQGAANGGFSGTSPVHLSAWSKLVSEFVVPQLVVPSSGGQTVSLVEASDSAFNLIKIPIAGTEEEYFLVENRQRSGYDAGFAAIFDAQSPGGLAIWHVKENVTPIVELERANNIDGYGTASNLYAASNVADFTPYSTPSSAKRDGAPTQIAVTNVSVAASTMTAVVQTLAEPPTSCSEFSATLDAHVSAGRAYSQDSGWFWVVTKNYYATGSGDSLGTTGTQVVTLYSDTTGVYEIGSCPTTDTTPPVITLNGLSPFEVNQGEVFSDPGATAIDNVDGDISSQIQVSGNVNTSVIGSYTLVYSVSDSAGNSANPVSRVVNVVAAPSCTSFTATLDQHVAAGRAYKQTSGFWFSQTTNYYALGSDQSLGSNGTTIKTLHKVATGVFEQGSCPVVQDPVAPNCVLTLIESNRGDGLTYLSGTASDANNNLSSVVVSVDGASSQTASLNATAGTWALTALSLAKGNHSVDVVASDATGLTNQCVGSGSFVVTDTRAPSLSLNGMSTMQLTSGQPFVDPGAVAVDDFDGDISALIQVSGGVDTNVVGSYTLQYHVTDSSGNAAGPITRAVTVNAGSGSGNGCKEYVATISKHLTAGRAYACGNFNLYGCAVGSNTNLGFQWGSAQIVLSETSPGFFVLGACP